MSSPTAGKATAAAAAGVVANVILGTSSLFWRALGGVPATTLLLYRITVSLVTLVIAMSLLGRFRGLRSKLTAKVVLIHVAAAALVVTNWGTFIWASIHGHVIESGLGYLIAPFVAIAVGALVFKDRMSPLRLTGLGIIVVAVAALLSTKGDLAHWVYLTIGLTWGSYACLKKVTTLDSFAGLLVETVALTLLVPVALSATSLTMQLPAHLPSSTLALLFSCGVVSVVPLILFAFAATRLPLSAMGFFQFVLPTTQLVVALLIYKQPVSHHTLLCFSGIWMALLLIVGEPLWKAHRVRQLAGARNEAL